ncbi:MAG: gamma carbonic anhydrase family protein [Deferribacteraceae bacterium]|jgi:carbonic anhydrase/acetyltransferase-like protein (isoleucine patch superfamily)|nr:gamma carbonic anhydrase family protein [Deferribacteraceae bacterium]
MERINQELLRERLLKGPIAGRRVFVADNATVIGAVHLGDDTSVWFQTCIRADVNEIHIGSGSNVQDGSVLHVGWSYTLRIGENTTVGHNVNLHGCTIGNNVLVGLGAIVLDGALISDDTIIAAGSVVAPRKTFPPKVMLMGSPAKVARELNDDDLEFIRSHTSHYIQYKDTYISLKARGFNVKF